MGEVIFFALQVHPIVIWEYLATIHYAVRSTIFLDVKLQSDPRNQLAKLNEFFNLRCRPAIVLHSPLRSWVLSYQ